jgi:hypothetical protein
MSMSFPFSKYFDSARSLNRALVTSGSTTVVFTGHWEPQEIFDTERIHEAYPQFEHFKLKTVVRGTKAIVDEWKNHFPDRYPSVGHTGSAIERISVTNYLEMFKIVCSTINSYLVPLPILELSSCQKERRVKILFDVNFMI